MKRFLSIILTAAMLMSATPAVFAENSAAGESVVAAEEVTPENQEKITEEVTENVTEDVSEEISNEEEKDSNEKKENSEEQTGLMSEENDISLSDVGTGEVQYSTDGSTWTSSTLADAVTAIGTDTGTIKVMADITLNQGLWIQGNITIIPDGKTVTITRGFANGTEPNGSNVGDAMFYMYKVYNSSSDRNNDVANLTLKGENGNKLVIDGNSETYGTQCAAPILYLYGDQNVTPGYDAQCTIGDDVVFQNNTNKVGNGGGITISNAFDFNMDGAIIQGCKATKNGGAIYYDNVVLNSVYQSKATFKNTVFKDNAAEEGGALYYDESITTIENCTFEANTASGFDGGAAIYTNGFTKVNI